MSNVKKLLMSSSGGGFVEPAQWYATDWPRTYFGITNQDAKTCYYDHVNNYYYTGMSNASFNFKATETQVIAPGGSGSSMSTANNPTNRFTDAGNGYVGAACGNRYVGWNYNGGTWTMKQYTTVNAGWEDICYTGTKWFFVGNSGYANSATVSLGSSWPSSTTAHYTPIRTALSNRVLDFKGCASDGNGTVVAVGTNANNDEGVVSTDDCATWTKITDLAWSALTIRSVRYADNLWVVTGTNGKIYTATNPTSGNWTDVSSNYPSSSETLEQVFYDHTWDLWWAYGGFANCRYTSDFSSWSGNLYNDAVSDTGVAHQCRGMTVGQNAVVIWGRDGRGYYGPL